MLTELWKRIESSSGTGDNILDVRKIDVRVDRSEYSGVMELVSDVQLMLKHAIQYYGFSTEVRCFVSWPHGILLFFEFSFRLICNSIYYRYSIKWTRLHIFCDAVVVCWRSLFLPLPVSVSIHWFLSSALTYLQL